MSAFDIEGITRKFRVSLTIEISAADMARVRGELLEHHPDATDCMSEGAIDAANVNGVVCGALYNLANQGGFQTPDLCNGAEGTIIGITHANAKVRADYTVTEEACARC